MMRQLWDGPDFCAVTEDGLLVEYIPKETGGQGGEILIGKIGRLMPSLNCAFVDIGRRLHGFLPLNEESKGFSGAPIRSGERAVFQVKKEEKDGKGAFLTRDITLAGERVILMPVNRYIGVSGRIREEETRNQLKALGREIAGDRFGLVMRASAENAGAGDIRQETERLLALWNGILKRAEGNGGPGTILYSHDILEQLKEDYARVGFDEIIRTEKLESRFRRQLRQAEERKVSLPGGGNIILDRCEAMTVIDVNTASAGGASREQTILETNLEACEAIARQTRLRNLSGMILIDFIDMTSEEERISVSARLQECFLQDRVKTVIHGWTSLGLMEMTRKRGRPSLYEERMIPCRHCGGSGYVSKESAE